MRQKIIIATVFATALALALPGIAQASRSELMEERSHYLPYTAPSTVIAPVTQIAPAVVATTPVVAPAIPITPCPVVDTRTAYIDTVTGLTLKATQGVKFISPSVATLLGTGSKALTMSIDTATSGFISFDTVTSLVTVESNTAVGTYTKIFTAITDSVTSTSYNSTIIVSAPVTPAIGAIPTCGVPTITPVVTVPGIGGEDEEEEGDDEGGRVVLAPVIPRTTGIAPSVQPTIRQPQIQLQNREEEGDDD